MRNSPALRLSPKLAVGRELVRAFAGLALAPVRAGDYLLRREALEAEARADLEQPELPTPVPPPPALPQRPLRLFVSCAEASGEVHAIAWVEALRARLATLGAPAPEVHGFGGARLAAAGVECIGDPVARAAMGLGGVGAALPFYLRLLTRASEHFREARPDLVLPVDSPALHVPLGHLARAAGRPVVHYVTPQYWGWAPWRLGGYRKAVDLALSILPFEPAWFRRHGLPVAHVGHPQWDRLAHEPRRPAAPDAAPVTAQGSAELALLPGSREGVIRRNLPWMLGVLREVRSWAPELRVVLPHAREELAPLLRSIVDAEDARDWVRVAIGDLHAELRRAHAAFSVSGTVLIDLLHHRLPTVVVYRLHSAREAWLGKHFLTVPYFASPNLLAAREVLPEFVFHGEGPREAVSKALLACYKDPSWRRRCIDGLELAAERLGPYGASERAAAHALAAFGSAG